MEISKLIAQGKDITIGHINEALGLNDDISAKRLAICYKCPIYNPRFGGVCDHNYWLNPDTNEISRSYKAGYYRGCGCRTNAKTRLPQAVCPAKKW